jgi:very-short-patch-repair endonuclease
MVRPPGAPVDLVIGRLASASHGVVTRAELVRAGVTAAEIKHRLGTGALLREHRGVFRVGHRAFSVEARYLAAVRACGEGAVLSGRAAAHLYGLVRGEAPPPEVIARYRRRVSGVKTRQARGIDERDVTVWRGIPITTVARTLVDLSSQVGPDELGRACHEAGVRYGTTPRKVQEVLARRPNTPGARKIRRIVVGDGPILLSKLERRFHTLLRDNGLPLPAMNTRVGRYRVDCRWNRPPLTVELDGYRYHRSRHAWEQDRRREREARARGDDFRRYTYGDVYEDPRLMLDELRGLLSGLQ